MVSPKLWTLLGVVTAVAGVGLLLSGIDRRFSEPPHEDLRREDTALMSESPADTTTLVPAPTARPEVLAEPATDHESNTSEKRETLAPPDSQKVPTPVARLTNDTDGKKKLLMDKLRKDGWTAEELIYLTDLFNDPRSHYRSDLLVRNSTFQENAEIYKHNLVPEALARCADFLDQHRSEIGRSALKDGVAPEVVVAILKVETNLGVWSGKESVFNVFWSLALGDHPAIQKALLKGTPAERKDMKSRMTRRAAWARGQLRDLLYVGKHGGEDPVGIMGSFAGAFGMSQFIPSSYRTFGRDGDGDGVVDLDNLSDASASISFYLKENGWRNESERARRRKVVLTYNHSQFYADCVMDLADSIAVRNPVRVDN